MVIFMKKCIYEDKACTNCGDCICELDPNKICDNCEQCLMQTDAEYYEILIDEIMKGEGE